MNKIYDKVFMMRWKLWNSLGAAVDGGKKLLMKKREGIDGILVTVGLCIIALLLCVVMKDKLASFIETIVTSLTTKAAGILSGT